MWPGSCEPPQLGGSRVVAATVFVDNSYGDPGDFDVATVRLDVTCQVLQ